MNLPELANLKISGKRVFVRADLDVPLDGNVVRDDTRLNHLAPTVKKLIEMGAAKIFLVGHLGRSGPNEEFVSSKILVESLEKILVQKIFFRADIWKEDTNEKNFKIVLLENIRSFPEEEKNNEEFAKKLSLLADIYVNEAWATSHRKHASIVGVPKFLPHAAGTRLIEEVDNLSNIIKRPNRPLIFIISGIKKDKLDYVYDLKDLADKILLGGRLPTYLRDDFEDKKIIPATLNFDGFDLSLNSIKMFEDEITNARTIILAGVPGKYEETGQMLGTKRVFEAAANSSGLKIASGGDTESAITLLKLHDKFDWISVGGGAMLTFLAKGTLPGIQALIE